MSALEALAVALGLVNIVLIVRRSVWNYPFGIAMVVLYARIFWDAKLYSDALLQVFFLVVQIYGWRAWAARESETGDVDVRALNAGGRVRWAIGIAAAAIVWGSGMARFTDASFPYWDATVAMLSIAAQILMTRRWIENWWGWIAVNVLSVGLYAAKALYLTMGLYAVFLAIAIWGWFSWRRVERPS